VTFSIAIPVHNGEKYLKATLASAMNQRRPADEIVVVDDGSTDRSAEIVQETQATGAVRYIYNGTPTGFADAWNRAIQFSKSEFVTVLHQDDVLDPRYLEIMEGATREFPGIHHFFTGYSYTNELGEITKKSPLPHDLKPVLYSGTVYAHKYIQSVERNEHIHRCPGVLSRRSLIIERCAYRKEAGLIADDDFFLRVGQYTDVVGISEPLAQFRIHSESATARVASLTHRLAVDYEFAVRYHFHRSSHLDKETIKALGRLSIRFINLLLFEGCYTKNKEFIRTATELARTLDREISGWRKSSLPYWSRILWMVSINTKMKLIATWFYCHGLSFLNKFRKAVTP
jgi:glycosyltransferase involved in cell wall biosynthesis